MSTSTSLPADYADRLYALLLGTWRPKRASRMNNPGAASKYTDIPDYTFSRADVAEHLAGRKTYAVTLSSLKEARAGCKDYDDTSEAEIDAALDQLAARGITASAFLMPDGRAHLWVLFDRPYPVADIRALLRTIPRKGKGEDYPSGNPIRVPFGYHKARRTRGDLKLQNRRRIPLDTELAEGLAAFFALPLNGKPEPAALGDARGDSGAIWGDAYRAEHWENLPDGAALWRSARVARAAQPVHRAPLAALLRGERAVITKKDDTLDDSDSAQVSALVFNLLSANFPENEIRAIALHLKPTIRPGRSVDHFTAHIDAELVRYQPRHYRPEPTRSIAPARPAEPAPLPPAQHRPEPKSRARKDRPQKVAGAIGYLEWLRERVDQQSGTVLLSQSQCAAAIGCNVRTIKRYEKQLQGQIERRVFAQRQAGCLFITAPDVVTTSPADVVIAEPDVPLQERENAAPAPNHKDVHSAPLDTSPLDPPVPARPATRGELRRWCAEAFDRLGDVGAQLSFARVRKYVLSDAGGRPVDLDQLRAIYECERDKRQRDRTWARLVDSLPTMKQSRLNTLSRQVDRILDGGADGPERGFYGWAAALQPHISAEQDRRGDMADRLRPRGKRRRTVTVEEAILLAELDETRRAGQFKENRGDSSESAGVNRGQSGGSSGRARECSPQTTPAAPQTVDMFTPAPASVAPSESELDAARLIAALKTNKARQQQATGATA